MLEKRKFIKEFVREENGEKKYLVVDHPNQDVFVDRIFNDKDASLILILVEQAYNQGLEDMANHIKKQLNYHK